jgi:hypothetical protein
VTRIETVNIRPGVTVLSVLRHLNYKPWFALAEFVDNSIQSYTAERLRMTSAEKSSPLGVTITYDKEANWLEIKDTAGGIRVEDYERAFRPAELPPDRSGLSEFGMGMKSAACWFSPRWEVVTSALGEPVERTIRFDIEAIVNDQIDELQVSEKEVDAHAHYTHVRLTELYSQLHPRTVGKIKEHLSDIYREFIRENRLALSYDGTPLTYETPSVLRAPFFDTPDVDPVVWKKDINFDFGNGMRVRGFAALRDPGSVRRAGFALFRRNRLIQGSGDEGYRPRSIFKDSNSYTYQRLFGELHLEGFQVSHTKDGIKWDENEVPFLELLAEHLDREPMPLLKQAEGHRKRRKAGEITGGAIGAAESTTRVLRNELPGVLDRWKDDDSGSEGRETGTDTVREVAFLHDDVFWRVRVTLLEQHPDADWLSVEHESLDETVEKGRTTNYLNIKLALLHPFMDRFAGNTQQEIEPLLRLAAGLAIAEHLALSADVRGARFVRRGLNRLLREGLALP